MELLAILAVVALVWLIDRTRGNGNTSVSGGNVNLPVQGSGTLPAGLPNAVAQVESGGQQYDSSGNVLVSSQGAIGIMQLMPDTAAGLGVDPYDPNQNYQGGTQYLNQLYSQFNGDLNDTLAAYNWGPGNVQNALQSGQSFPSSVMRYINKVLSVLNGGGS